MKTVCLETAMKLREAGYPQDNHWFYHKNELRYEGQMYVSGIYSDEHQGIFDSSIDYSAPCACELLEQLPKEITYEQKQYRLCITAHQGNPPVGCDIYDVCYMHISEGRCALLKEQMFNDKSLAEACAGLWLWCKKEVYIK